jgi:hypothetical protein
MLSSHYRVEITNMPCTDKLFMIREYFADFQNKINRLENLYKAGYKDEAWTLCFVYIDQLASGKYYDGKEGSNKKNFCRALSDHSGDSFFSMLHPQKLLGCLKMDSTKDIRAAIDLIVQGTSNQFLSEDEVSRYLENSSLNKRDRASIVANLWRASVASICYDRLRCQAIHGPGTGINLTFSNTTYNGCAGIVIDFDRLYNAAKSIFRITENVSIETGNWFGNPSY